MGKDKARGKSSFSKARAPKENLAEDDNTEKQEESLLAECKSYLSIIFTHWQPVLPLCESQPPPDKPDPSRLATDTAHLLTKWSLRCLVEDSYDEKRTREFLRWVERVVIKHREIVDAVLLDPGWKADLVRLHHQAFEALCPSSLSARAETLQLLTNIMMHLLETQGQLPDMYQKVVSACLHKAPQDQCRHGKSLQRLSILTLYCTENLSFLVHIMMCCWNFLQEDE